jgi:hypothetical protein
LGSTLNSRHVPDSAWRRRGVGDAALVEPRLPRGEIARRESQVVDHAGALRGQGSIPVDVQDGLRHAAVEPCARNAQFRPVPFVQAEQAEK